jgi:DNA-binding GntR family transcriptional regulator
MPHNARDVIVATGLADEIAFRLQAAVLDGEYAPGTHLNQDDLCARFGVSRTPVREALRKLQAQHLVELVPNKGATVRVPTRKDLAEVYAVRAELEGYACELAASRMKPEAIANLRKLQSAVAEQIELLEADAVDSGEEAAFNSRVTRANERFHAAIYRAAGNERLVAIISDLQSYFPKDYVWRATRHRPEGHQLGVENHERIVSALEAGDGAAAREAMEEHIRFAGRLLLEYLDEHHFWSS